MSEDQSQAPDLRLDAVLARLDAQRAEALDRLFALLRIPSISTDPAFDADTARAADWMAETLRDAGFAAEVMATEGHPMVVAEAGPETGPHVLFYGHYDVQPVDPLDLWDRDPFDPALEEQNGATVIRARGAADDKGQLMTFVEACRAWIAETGALPCRVTVFLEGEEESGSPSLLPFLEAHGDRLRADVALICDTNLYARGRPGIVTQLRGLLGEEITIIGPRIDLHSGYFGGIGRNPIRVLSRILGNLHGEDGRIQVPGFYDGVTEPAPEVKAGWDALDFDAQAFLGAVGLSQPAGEEGRTPLEMVWSRPTGEINGIWGGYTGAGFKTVLPSQAHAKVSFRLVAGQDPHALRKAFRAWVEAQLPPDCSVAFAPHGAAPAAQMDISHPAFAITRNALSAEWPEPAAYIGNGGSIPVAGYFKSLLGMDSVLAGFGNDDDAIHSPNEKYDLASFENGARAWARVLSGLGQV